jgi:hypothetical protein
MNRLVKSLVLGMAGAVLFASSANAAMASFSVVPTAWRLQDYTDGGVYAFFTPSQCQYGKIYLPPSANEGAKSRFWAVVTSAKIARKSVNIEYDTTTCVIISFALDSESL